MELHANNALKNVLYAMDQQLLNVQLANNHIILKEPHANVISFY